MYFVGRAKEINKIHRALEQGENIIVQGKYGMGRTSLLRHLAAINQERWQFWFADFSQTPEKVCRQLFAQMFPDAKNDQQLKYKSLRQQITAASLRAEQKIILVMDNIAAVTPARMEFWRYLGDNGQFSFIAIAENSLKRQERMQLRGVLHLTCQISLSYLRLAEVREFFQHYSTQYGWNWSAETIASVSQLTRGYPLFMAERVNQILYNNANDQLNISSLKGLHGIEDITSTTNI